MSFAFGCVLGLWVLLDMNYVSRLLCLLILVWLDKFVVAFALGCYIYCLILAVRGCFDDNGIYCFRG